MLKEIIRSPRWAYITALVLFAIMLVANILTPMASDDFSYCFSFAEGGERIDSLDDIIPSLIAHGEYMNGRYIAHYFTHLFLLLPGWVFDILNSVVFVALAVIIYKIATYKKERNNLLLAFLFGMMWLCQSDFGQVNLWLDGACNYLWAVFFGVLFIAPYLMYLLYGEELRLPWLLPFLLVSFLSGNFMENISPAFILVGGLCLLASTFILGRKIRYEQILGILFSGAGFVLMMAAPGEWINKVTDGEASTLLNTVFVAIGVLLTLALPITLSLLLLIKRIKNETWRSPTVLAALILIIGALASNFVLVIAAYYPLRCSVGCTAMILFALVFLLSGVELKLPRVGKVLCILLLVSISLSVAVGMVDITRTFILARENEKIILDARERGEREVRIRNITPFTKYSALCFLKYIDTERPDSWPNTSMAKYYGMDLIYGYEE